MSTLGERIKKAREMKGYLQSDLAKLIGVKSSGVISNWEKDLNKPDAEKIVKICGALDVSASFLLDYYGKSTFECTPLEQELLKKYRTLDAPGKEAVDYAIDHENTRSSQITALEEQLQQSQSKNTFSLIPEESQESPGQSDQERVEREIEREVAEYRRELELEARRAKSPASGTTSGRKEA